MPLMDVISSGSVEAMPLQPTTMSGRQEFIPMSIGQELDQKFLTDRLIKTVLIRALAALPRVPSSYKCNTCGKSFSSFQALGGHKSIHNTNNKRTRDEPTKIFVAKPRKRPRSSWTEAAASEEKSFECGVCSKAFSTYQALGGHKSVHNPNNKSARDEPTKIFIEETASEKPFECGICNKTFSTHQALGGHKGSHKRAACKAAGIVPTYLQLFPKSASPRLFLKSAIDLELRL